MIQLADYFHIEISQDKMSAQMLCKDTTYLQQELEIDEPSIRRFFDIHHILYGVLEESIDQILSGISEVKFPLQIAKGLPVINGEDGRIEYELNMNSKLERTPDWDFRDVMRIPCVVKGQKLASLVNPTTGVEGINVSGVAVSAKPGKPINVKAGNNVVYREENMSFYAAIDGQISVVGRYIHIYPVFELKETLTMKTGNLNFVGTIIIHGDVPSGFHVKAEGDIKIYGMVEAGTIIAGGSIYISEGLAGQGKGSVKAGENVTMGYINQGIVHAENNLYVENSILHSECMAMGDVYCQKGNIIGGTLSAGKSVEAKDIGNRLSTKTEIIFGINKTLSDKEEELTKKQNELKNKLQKLALIGNKLREQDTSNPKLRISQLRQKNSFRKTEEQLRIIEEMLANIHSKIGSEQDAYLTVRNFIHQNTIIAFGKYKKQTNTNYHFVKINLVHNEIMVHPLFD